MTQKEKAERYDKAIERARKLKEDPQSVFNEYSPKEGDTICDYIFPELAESVDEKIRKALIDFFQDWHKTKPSRWSISVSDVIAWLEKQGEQKPIDKIKPKFKIGDWIIYSNEEVHLITDFDDNGYFVDNKEYYIPFNCEGNMRLWTIEDAKRGDVLATPNYIYIFNSIDKETETVGYHCLMKKSDKHFSFGDYKIHDEILNSIPATKEQRDTFFTKIKESGYEWSEETDELNKIDQKHIFSEDDENRISRLIAYFEDKESFSAEDDIAYANWLKSLKERVAWKPSEEQMNALSVTVKHGQTDDQDALKKLLEQLKKL